MTLQPMTPIKNDHIYRLIRQAKQLKRGNKLSSDIERAIAETKEYLEVKK